MGTRLVDTRVVDNRVVVGAYQGGAYQGSGYRGGGYRGGGYQGSFVMSRCYSLLISLKWTLGLWTQGEEYFLTMHESNIIR